MFEKLNNKVSITSREPKVQLPLSATHPAIVSNDRMPRHYRRSSTRYVILPLFLPEHHLRPQPRQIGPPSLYIHLSLRLWLFLPCDLPSLLLHLRLIRRRSTWSSRSSHPSSINRYPPSRPIIKHLDPPISSFRPSYNRIRTTRTPYLT